MSCNIATFSESLITFIHIPSRIHLMRIPIISPLIHQSMTMILF